MIQGEDSLIPEEWRTEFEAAARRPLEQRMRYAFIQTNNRPGTAISNG